MHNLSLSQIIDFTEAELLQGNKDQMIEEVVIDSRDVKDNYLFIAIIGENQDGHLYLSDAVKNGASAVIVDRKIESEFGQSSKTAVLKVADRFMSAYIKLKLMTGLRKSDLLTIRLQDIKDYGLHVRPSKTAHTTGQEIIFELKI